MFAIVIKYRRFVGSILRMEQVVEHSTHRRKLHLSSVVSKKLCVCWHRGLCKYTGNISRLTPGCLVIYLK